MNTSYSLLDNFSWGSLSLSSDNKSTSLSASDLLTYFLPVNIVLIAFTSSSGALYFVRYPDIKQRLKFRNAVSLYENLNEILKIINAWDLENNGKYAYEAKGVGMHMIMNMFYAYCVGAWVCVCVCVIKGRIIPLLFIHTQSDFD